MHTYIHIHHRYPLSFTTDRNTLASTPEAADRYTWGGAFSPGRGRDDFWKNCRKIGYYSIQGNGNLEIHIRIFAIESFKKLSTVRYPLCKLKNRPTIIVPFSSATLFVFRSDMAKIFFSLITGYLILVSKRVSQLESP